MTEDTQIKSGCPICGDDLKYNTKYRYFLKTCGKDSCKKEQNFLSTKNAIKLKYGVDNISKLDTVKQKKINTFIEHYGVSCGFMSDEVKEKIKNTNIDRYGKENPMQNEDVRKRTEITNLNKYGAKNPMQNEVIQQKMKDTCMSKYGVEWPLQNINIQEKIRQTLLDRYGKENPMQNEIIQQKMKDTCMGKYGVEWPCERDECRDQNYLYKTYMLPSGKEIKIQGYEYKFLDEYFKRGGNENNVICDNKTIKNTIGEINYFIDNKKHRYYPDFYLIKENKIVEVKSKWTYDIEKPLNEIKRRSCINMGLDFEFKIY